MESGSARLHYDALYHARALPHDNLSTPVVLQVGPSVRVRALDGVAVARRHTGGCALDEPSADETRKDHQPPGVGTFTAAWGSVAHDR